MSQSGYHKIERDEVGIDLQKLGKIADLLKVTIPTILDFDDKNLTFHQYNNTYAGYNTFTSEKELYDKLIAEKDARIATQGRELETLRKMVALLEKK